ncbi:hypothetical protein [Sorangium sp. So ce117]|uniref:hypothetical protein n=1 Tax=Sorangium sp. So ce117 TaxID=3133277 RepID=UPI003F63FAE4
MFSIRLITVCAIIASAVACVPKATPVTPQPLAAEEQVRINGGLKGPWKEVAAKVGDGERKSEAMMRITFNPDGTYLHEFDTPFGVMRVTYKYRLDGKNVLTDSPHGTYRVDELSGDLLTLFNYDATTTWYLERAK